MKISQHARISSLFLLIAVLLSLPGSTLAAANVSLGLVDGIGTPVGWWGDRWDMIYAGEMNLKVEFSPGIGLLIVTGLNKSYLLDRTPEEIAAESSFGDVSPEFLPYRTITVARESGSFKQIPVGVGAYYERAFGKLTPYASVAMVVYNWKVIRDQNYQAEIAAPNMGVIYHNDQWQDEIDGSNLGAQIALGTTYQLVNHLYLDCSVAMHMLNIGRESAGVAYYGYPARSQPGAPVSDLLDNAESVVNSLHFRIGLRVGS